MLEIKLTSHAHNCGHVKRLISTCVDSPRLAVYNVSIHFERTGRRRFLVSKVYDNALVVCCVLAAQLHAKMQLDL